VVNNYNFSKFNKIIDVGGNQGYLLSTILYKFKKPQGIVFDQPHVVTEAKQNFNKFGIAERAQAIGGNFFESVPEGGDAYLLKNVIHDWDDEKSILILKNVHKSMIPGGKLILIESLISEDNEPSFGKLTDLLMLVGLDGARERTRKEFEQLFNESGFKLSRVIHTVAPFSFIEGEKV
jgi:hypothetical protein